MNKIQNIYDNPHFFEQYKLLREDTNNYNEMVEQPAIFSLLTDLQNKTILDIGCGFGDFARSAIAKGATSILGIDVSKNMLDEAKKITNNRNIVYQQIAVESFTSPKNTFDLVVSSFVFNYVDNFKEIINKIHHWLKPGGSLIFSIEHPMRTASYMQRQIKQDELGREFYPIYNYRDENFVKQTWFVDNIQKYHRKISTYINTLIEGGLKIENILELMPTDELVMQYNKFSAHKISPPILIIKAKKS